MRFPVSVTLPLLAVLAAQLVGCASMGRDAARFPTKEQIEELSALPRVKLGDVPILDVADWKLESPLATRLGGDPVSPVGPWETSAPLRRRRREEMFSAVRALARALLRSVPGEPRQPLLCMKGRSGVPFFSFVGNSRLF